MNWKRDLGLRSLKLLNILLVTGCFAAVWYLYYNGEMGEPFFRLGNYAIIAVFAALYTALGRTYDAFLISYSRPPRIIFSQWLAVLLADAVMLLIMGLLFRRLPTLWPGLITLAAQFCLSALWTLAATAWYFRAFEPLDTAVIYDAREGMETLIEKYGFSRKYRVIVNLSAAECLADLSRLDACKTVFLSGVHSHDRNLILKYCVEKDIQVMVIPRIGDVIMSGAHPMHMFHLPILRTERRHLLPEYAVCKRFSDIILSCLLLLLLSPVMLLTAAAIRLSDGGPVFFRQIRLTKDGRQFRIIKFRSMRPDAEDDETAPRSACRDDPRITPVGRVIRRWRIDELPQLFNILRGDMSMVGPRPERLENVIRYERELPEFRLRLQVKAGLTGYAQVYGKYNSTPYDKLMMDLMYIAHPSLVMDLSILLATLKTLFEKESTEGFDQNQMTGGDGQ